MRVTFHGQLSRYSQRKRFVYSLVCCRKLIQNPFALLIFSQCSTFRSCQQVVQFGNQSLHSRDELNQAFRNQYRTKIVSIGRTVGYNLSNISNDIIQSLVFGFHLFRYDTNVGLALQSAFQSDVRSRTSHQFDEMPIFTGRVCIALDIADNLCMFVLQISVNGLRTSDNLHTAFLGCVIFSQDTSVRIGVVATDDDNGFNSQFLDDFKSFFELFLFFEFGTSGTDHVKTARIAILVYDVSRQFHIFVVHQSAGTQNKAIQLAFRVQSFNTVEQSANDIMPAGSLASGKNYTDVERGVRLSLARNELNKRHSISVRE